MMNIKSKSVINTLLLVCLTTALFFVSSCGTEEAPGAIYGTVRLIGRTNHADVDVSVQGTTLVTKTNNEGLFVILDVPPGNYTVEASKSGYVGQVKEGIVIQPSDAVMGVDFDLISLTPPDLPE